MNRLRFAVLLFVLCLAAQQTAPVVSQKQDPEYSDEVPMARLEGAVALSVIVGGDGRTRDVTPIH